MSRAHHWHITGTAPKIGPCRERQWRIRGGARGMQGTTTVALDHSSYGSSILRVRNEMSMSRNRGLNKLVRTKTG